MLHHCVEEITEWTSSHNSLCKELKILTTTNSGNYIIINTSMTNRIIVNK